MASALKAAALGPRDRSTDEARTPRGRSEWLDCTPDTPWGVHGRMVGECCTRCGWER
jgi:hypothetical protein